MFLLNEERALDDYTQESAWEEIPTKEYVRVERARQLLATIPSTPTSLERAKWAAEWAEEKTKPDAPLTLDDDPWSRYLQEEDDIGGG